MTQGSLRYRTYAWGGSEEWLAEVGEGRPILIAPPLFEELNRCRAFIVAIMRDLAQAGFRVVLPDLPGTVESPRDLSEIAWNDWVTALASLACELKVGTQDLLLLSFRGGSLIDVAVEVSARWRFAPAQGSALTRDLVRARQAASPDKIRAEEVITQARTTACEFAGYLVPPHLFAELHDASPSSIANMRTVRLSSDPADADLKVDGRPLWRQAEPGIDTELSARLAQDIMQWARSCDG